MKPLRYVHHRHWKLVTYPNSQRSNNLLEVNSDGNAIMRVETTGTVATNRMSVRITTKSTFDGMLIIMDSIHMPSGCGTWPYVSHPVI